MKTSLRHAPPFVAPQWCFNGHIHTMARSLIGDTKPPDVDRIEISTPDDDFLELDCFIQPDSDAIIVLFEAMPIAKINQNKFTDYIITEDGGHVGFWSKPKGWLNFAIENYLSSNI